MTVGSWISIEVLISFQKWQALWQYILLNLANDLSFLVNWEACLPAEWLAITSYATVDLGWTVFDNDEVQNRLKSRCKWHDKATEVWTILQSTTE